MPIEYVEGNLLKSDCDVIAHGCNCFLTMGSGIARQIRDQYPQAYYADQRTISGDKSKLGTLTYVNLNGRIVVNLYTQYRYGGSQDHFSYDTFPEALKALENVINEFEVSWDQTLKVGIPFIGAGLAGGDWKRIEAMILEAFPERTIYVFIYKP